MFENAFHGLHKLHTKIRMNYQNKNVIPDKEEDFLEKLDEGGNIAIPCDKKMGMSIFNLNVIKEADKRLMGQLKAVYTDKTKDEVYAVVLSNIDDFENELSDEQKHYIDYVYSDRNIRKCKLEIPFLRSTHKIHKMSLIIQTCQLVRNADESDLLPVCLRDNLFLF